MQIRFVFLLVLIIFIDQECLAQIKAPDEGPVKWMALENAMVQYTKQPKPILIDFYTDWCGWCKRMMQTTYANQSLADYINQNFYPVRFNAETKDTVEFLGEKYGPVGDGPKATNALAIKLLQDKLVYPTTLFLNNFDKEKNTFGLNMLAAGYLEEKKIEPMLVFTLENVSRTTSFNDFNTEFEKAFYDTTTDAKLKELKWVSPVTGFSHVEKKEKKTLVFIHTDWCNSCKVMQRATFPDDSCLSYLQSKYELVDFNPDLTDTIVFKGQTFVNPKNVQMPIHQLAFTLSRNNFVLPTLAILDENMNLVDAISSYLHPALLKDILRYYGDDVYKNKTWKDYMESKKSVQ